MDAEMSQTNPTPPPALPVPAGPVDAASPLSSPSPLSPAMALAAPQPKSDNGGRGMIIGLAACWVIGNPAGAVPPGSSFFNSSTVADSRVKVPPSGILNAWSFATMFSLYSGSFVARSTACRPIETSVLAADCPCPRSVAGGRAGHPPNAHGVAPKGLRWLPAAATLHREDP